MSENIKFDYEIAGGWAKNLLYQFPDDHISPDGISNLPAVPKGYIQGEKGKSLVADYEALITKDAAKISDLSTRFDSFDKEVARSLSGNQLPSRSIPGLDSKQQHVPLIFVEPNS